MLVVVVIGGAAGGYYLSLGRVNTAANNQPRPASSTTSSTSEGTTTSTVPQQGSSSNVGSIQSAGTGGAGCTPGDAGAVVVRGYYKGFVPSAINITVGQSVHFTMGPMNISCTFTQAGTFIYHCADHPLMVATVNVRK
jgi:plastocyanin